MSKLIVEMEMPTVCDECPMMYDGIVCAATGTEVYPNRQARILKNGREFDPCENRLDDCPICGELPDEHGDLINREYAIASTCSGLTRTIQTTEGAEKWIRVREVRESIKSAPIIIPAERKKEKR